MKVARKLEMINSLVYIGNGIGVPLLLVNHFYRLVKYKAIRSACKYGNEGKSHVLCIRSEKFNKEDWKQNDC